MGQLLQLLAPAASLCQHQRSAVAGRGVRGGDLPDPAPASAAAAAARPSCLLPSARWRSTSAARPPGQQKAAGGLRRPAREPARGPWRPPTCGAHGEPRRQRYRRQGHGRHHQADAADNPAPSLCHLHQGGGGRQQRGGVEPGCDTVQASLFTGQPGTPSPPERRRPDLSPPVATPHTAPADARPSGGGDGLQPRVPRPPPADPACAGPPLIRLPALKTGTAAAVAAPAALGFGIRPAS